MPASESTESRSGRTSARRSASRSAPRTPRVEAPVVEVFFILGALLVVLGFLYAIARAWPSFDPLALAMLVGIGLLLVVVCERLRTAVHELRTLTTLMRRAITDASQEPPA
jgi:hypothetical protein